MTTTQIKTTFTPKHGSDFVTKSDIRNSVELGIYATGRKVVAAPAFKIIEQHREAYGCPAYQILEVERGTEGLFV